ncbi:MULTISPECIES: glucose-1-phosphate cytidylyltransferase [Sutcliffiella]|uniref:Glucose-1-phosphate cytidylyltransferase n=1 Tax=Sutcliffiella cohnii TaxID=33932 RepID=A0A223KMT9_9BACI|nr:MULTISPECIES: glucose-1-phosphate cytidylyltransferase [Sutcliffiella]AST90643.1 glucose-1-phosphate cytidylyltransferase [Sutcliffiella cohnii]MED4016931.1 glucose-1-phosphate cytidylyltransferase [Sutcliffiella cohnii]WBL16295.1 glucose-1-phosphate cytidylyltransferase [Sutcliffiella sp. NC1]
MKVVLLAGGYGTRLSEETIKKPKPLVEIGDKPILWHIMKIYSHFGYSDFIVCLGYKGHLIKQYFTDYFLNNSNVTVNLETNDISYLNKVKENWKITLVDTGSNTLTGGRLKRIESYLNNEPFMVTYGDGVSDLNIQELISFHKSHNKIATLTAVQPEGRFGSLSIGKENIITKFFEKPKGDNNWINGGFFVFEPEIFQYLSNDQTILEKEPLMNLSEDGELMAYKHHGFWHPMDTLKDKKALTSLWYSGNAPWKQWE